jgi:DNA repair exonuclease SbcCD nuclease subunit
MVALMTTHKMDTSKINPKNNKVLFFSDLHLGVHQNSQTWHKIALDLAEWINQVMKDNKLNTIFFAGDVFHDRHEIGVNTLHVAKKFFNILKDYNIHIVPGNHDAFLSSTVEINSVEILESENICVYTNPTTLTVGEKLVTFCPWKTIVKDLQKVDMLVGHFEIANFKMNATKICDHGDSSTDLLEKAEAVVTGHFHYREQRNYDDKFVLYLGSPYEMDFGDRNQQKGVSIIDFDDKFNVEFIENDLTPKHFRLKISELIQKQYTDLPNIVKNNIISVYVDTKIDTLTLDLLNTKLTQYSPLQFRTEFNVLDSAQVDTKDVKKLSIDIETAFQEFVEHVETRATKKEVLDKCIELYKLCQTSHE